MDLLNWSHRIDELTDENKKLREQMDDIIDMIARVVMDMSDVADYDTLYADIAKDLFEIIEQYGDENAVTDILEQFAHKTGISLND